MNTLLSWPTPYGLQLASSMRDRFAQRLRLIDHYRHAITSDRPSSPSPAVSPYPCDAFVSKSPAAHFSPCSCHLQKCDHPSSISPCNGPNIRYGDRLTLSQCKTPSLRRGSAKRSASLSNSPSIQTFGATLPKNAALNSWLSRGLHKFAEVLTIKSPQPSGLPRGERSFIPFCPTQAAGATA